MRRSSSVQRRGSGRRSNPGIEPLEGRVLFSTSIVNAGQNVRAVAPQLLGINTATWDGLLSSSTTLAMAKSAGLSSVRLPGGSTSDVYHFNTSPASNGYGQTMGQMAAFAANLGAAAIVTIDYGSGSPQEAIAEWAYLNGSPTDTTAIGSGPEFNSTTSTWGTPINWQTVGYWASLRAASPLKTDDGLNFLRLGVGSTVNHPQAFNITSWEIGNEEYGSTWETDGHGDSGDTLVVPGGKSKAHDPTTYVAFANQFATTVRSIISVEGATPISIGVDGPGADSEYNSWMGNVLKQGKTQGFIPDFISDHVYDQAPGAENDATLLGDPTTPTNATASLDWAQRATQYKTLITSTLGTAGANIQLWATEINSVYSDPGKQSTSLVNGLFLADSLGSLMQTAYNGAYVWDLHNGTPGAENNSASLYGWRTYGDYGIIGNGSGGTANQANPNYFAEQLASKIIQSGGEVVSASSDSTLLDTFAVKEPNGDLDLLVINKTPPGTLTPSTAAVPTVTETFNLQNFIASGAATIYQYGVAQDDTAASNGGTSALTQQSTTLSVSGSSFSYAVPDYSMTVIDLQPDKGPTVATAAAGPGSPVAGTSAALSVLGAENGSDTGLTYTWSATGPAAASFFGNTNRTNAAKSISALFTEAGTYQFTATIADPQGLSTTSSTTVTVAQTPTGIVVSPNTPTVVAGATQPFSAAATDQFGNAIVSPAFTWSTTGVAGSISSAGLLSVGSDAGSMVVSATLGSAVGQANVTVIPVPTVTSVIVNGNNPALAGSQRSMVDTVLYTFNQPVNAGANAFTIAIHTGQTGTIPTLSWTAINPAADGSAAQWAVTFSGNGVLGNSLDNGVYDITMNPAAVTSDAVPTATAQPRATDTFWRLFGDFAGNGYVSNADYNAFLSTYNLKSTAVGYLAAFDATGTNAKISNADYLDFLSTYGTRYKNLASMATI